MPEKRTTKKPTAKKAIAEKKSPASNKVIAEADQPVHIMLRLRAEGGRTIFAHADMIARKGAAVLGKMGRLAASPEFKDALNKQIESGVKTFLFLAMKEKWDEPYVMYGCRLRQVHDTLDETKRKLVPEYYAHEISDIKTWFEITSLDRLPKAYAERIFVPSSGRSAMSALNGMNSAFRVGVHKK